MKSHLKQILRWLFMVLVAIVVALIIRLTTVDFFTIPTDSMEPALQSGDFIVVNKWYYGPRFYRNIGESPETFRLPGYSRFKHNDIVVFNFPSSRIWEKLSMDTDLFYAKRCIGLPGDSLSIQNGFYVINGEKGYGDTEAQQILSEYKGEFRNNTFETFPFSQEIPWNIIHFGPLYIPKKGEVFRIDTSNIIFYARMIAYETNLPVQRRYEHIYLSDSIITHYTFRKNWYFLAGDKVLNSRDSRYTGLIPEDFIVGKVSFILYSRDPDTRKYKWTRWFKGIY